jgi:hypothetical protein
MRLAKGLAGDKPFAVIDTEAGRAKHYADSFKFDHGDLRAPFRPDAYAAAIKAADDAHYPVIVVDSASHEWAGDGGILDWQEEEMVRMAGNDFGKRERVKMASWIKPKMSHKQMVNKLLQMRAHIILCFRAEPKIEMVKEGGQLRVVPKQSLTGLDGWIPICEKSLPFEMTASFLLMADRPGVPHPIKLPQALKPFFPIDKAITEQSGIDLGAWARGGAPATTTPLSEAMDERATVMQAIKDACQANGVSREVFASVLVNVGVKAPTPATIEQLRAALAAVQVATVHEDDPGIVPDADELNWGDRG